MKYPARMAISFLVIDGRNLNLFLPYFYVERCAANSGRQAIFADVPLMLMDALVIMFCPLAQLLSAPKKIRAS